MSLRHLSIVGFGLIGGSLAAALRARQPDLVVTGFARSAETRRQALELGLADAMPDTLAEAIEGADIILLATPVLSFETVLAAIRPHLTPSQIITDAGSVKGSVVDAACRVFGELPPRFVLGHPIAGSENSGVTAARADLYQGRRVLLTPDQHTDPDAQASVAQMWRDAGAQVEWLGVEEHDQILAATSHLPHLLAFSLVDTLAHEDRHLDIFRYAAGGFRDFTRIAASDPVMWRDIFIANRTAMLTQIDAFADGLAALRAEVDRADGRAMQTRFARAKSARDFFTQLQEPQTMSKHWQVTAGATMQGTIRVPGDKSMSHRSIMLGAIAEGTTEVSGFLEGEDALATLQCFRDMGVQIDGPVDGRVTIHGVGMHGLRAPKDRLWMGNSGTSIRLLSGLLAGQSFDVTLQGDDSLAKRPMKRVSDPLARMGAVIETAEGGTPPLTLRGGAPLKGIHYDMPMASAQVKSAVLLAGLFADGETSVTEPAPTRDHTENMLNGFGYKVERDGATARLVGGGRLTACDIEVPADISSAAFFLVAASITPGADLTLTHVGVNPTRTGIIDILLLMGANIERLNEHTVGGEPVADLRVRYAPLKGIHIPEALVPLAIDELPVTMIAAACAEGDTLITGAEELRVKESDRIQAMVDGLNALGVAAEARDDGALIPGSLDRVFADAAIQTHMDHRIAMSFVIAATRASGTVVVRDIEHVATSFPNFKALCMGLGVKLSETSH
ncbi:bifunctional prephenate dehydrogenase/3-phosphoshikimate 1-carboxyvinyltransferase [Litorivicinus lipolyticus]|uniref:bifunctional prephenate dehydrogenase/3-phosphoshikimate 1-carboxyvinyltransferase n=1 Tax=Litorivicinus lipolyticus TaxID=418701 RepID=UPI001B8811B9|nr:bifunctional prephenate dehydrogenase/3-phosphoshikimate 1-carboxyvinyltransferase [Litorivicinus lipolyticus]